MVMREFLWTFISHFICQGESDSQTNSSHPDEIDEESPLSDSDNQVTVTPSTSASSAHPTDHHCYRRPTPPATSSISKGLFKHSFEFVIIYTFQPKESVVSQLILVSFGLGCTAVVVGSSIPGALPRLAKILREFGEHTLFTVIFSVIAMHLPLYLSWIMLLCWLITVASVRLGYSADSTATSTV